MRYGERLMMGHGGLRKKVAGLRLAAVAALGLGLGFGLAWVPAAEETADFGKTSVTLRTALHYDPSVEVPLQKLVELYRTAGRTEELLSLYNTHLTQYPDDAGASLVLARIYALLQDRKAGDFLKAAVARHPDNALLAWQLGRLLQEERNPKAVEAMASAVRLEKSAARKAQWFGELMKAAAVQGREDLVLEETRHLIEDGAMTPEQRLRWARQALGQKLPKTATRMMEGVDAARLGTDNQVDATMLQAELLAAEAKPTEAGTLLDTLLEKLAPDYWRRREILMLRLDVTGADGRDKMVEVARNRWLAKDGRTAMNALTLADVLDAAHRGREALQVLREALEALPGTPQVEQRLLDLWEKEGTDAAALEWLEKLMAAHPERQDLMLRQVRWLFANNLGPKAHETFKVLLSKLEPVDQVGRSVELSRWLRRRNQLQDAGLLLETALGKSPDRWDLRRELGELYFAQRRTDEVAALFEGDWTKNLTPDARLEIAQFLMSKQLWVDARKLVEPWLVAQPTAFEGHLLLAKIEEKLGDDARVAVAFEAARALCDTDARYQAWIEAVMQHAEAREMVELAVQKEAGLLAPGGKLPEDEVSFSRWLALIAQASAHKAEKTAEELLKLALTRQGLAADRALMLEKLRLDLMASDSTRAVETEAGLRKLLESDAAHREDHRLRLALLYHQAGRQDLAMQFLEALDASKVTEVAGLRSVVPICLERGSLALALTCAERLTRLEPAEMAHWSQWTNLLAQSGQEERLRFALREILGRAHDWKLTEAVRESLQEHLVASQWRSVMSSLNATDSSTWALARREAAALEKADLTSDQRRWMDWLVAYLSSRMGDKKAAEDAFSAFGKLSDNQWITFPDGMELSVAGARESLRENPFEATARAQSGPVPCLPPFSLGWGFSVDQGMLITRVVTDDASGLAYVVDDRSNVHALDLRTGKLRWRISPEGGSKPTRAASPSGGRTMTTTIATRVIVRGSGQPDVRTPVEISVHRNRLCLLENEKVTCVDARTGALLWRNQLAEVDGSAAGPPSQSRLHQDEGHVFVWQPGVSTVSSMNPVTGKLLWQTLVPSPPIPAPNPYNSWGGYDAYIKLKSGLSVEHGRVFVFAQSAALLRADSGQVLWRLATGDVPGFPIDLQSQGDSNTPLAQPPPRQLVAFSPARIQISGGYVSGLHITGMRGGMGAASAGWGYATGLRALLQGQGYYSPYATLHEGKVWMVNGNGTGMVSAMGLPLGQLSHSGMVVGVGEGQLVCFNGSSFGSTSPQRNGMQTTLGVVESVTSNGQPPRVDVMPSGSLHGSRLYASLGTRLRMSDLRSGSVLFDVPLPPEADAWAKTFVDETSPVQANTMAISSSRRSVSAGFQNRRTYLPSGVLYQNERGGGTLCGPTSAVAPGVWILPVNERALVCLRGAPMGPPAVSTNSPPPAGPAAAPSPSSPVSAPHP